MMRKKESDARRSAPASGKEGAARQESKGAEAAGREPAGRGTACLPGLFRGFFARESVPAGWDEVFRHLTGGGLREATERYRATREWRHKASLPSLMPACATNGRGKEETDVTGLTGVSMADFDGIPSAVLETVRAAVNADPHTLLSYVTVSGEGLRVLFRYEAEELSCRQGTERGGLSGAEEASGESRAAEAGVSGGAAGAGGRDGSGGEAGLTPEEKRLYAEAFLQGNCYYADLIGYGFDEKCANVNRLSALCHDPGAFRNEAAVPFLVEAGEASSAVSGGDAPSSAAAGAFRSGRADAPSRPDTALSADAPVSLVAFAVRSVERRGDFYVKGNRNQYLMRCLMRMNRLGVPQAEAEGWALSHDLGEAETRRIVRSCYRHTAEHGIYEAPSARGGISSGGAWRSGRGVYGTPAGGNGGWPEGTGVPDGGGGRSGASGGGRCDGCDKVTADVSSSHARAREEGPAAGFGSDRRSAPPYMRASGEEPAGQVAFPLPPPLPACEWPPFLQRMVDCGETAAQRDALLLGSLTVLGASLNRQLRSLYGRQYVYPCLQTFVVAPPASGKGALAWTRKLAEPLHDRMMGLYQRSMETYRREKAAYDTAGRARAGMPEPEQPLLKMFLIAGNNSATGILENLMNAGGVGLICESEADTVSTALGSDYGHWSDTLRKAFDHDRLAYNRRTNREYREIPHTYLSVLLSGTPAQVQPLIPSSENGLFSRQIFYAMPGATGWISQFDRTDEDMNERFGRWGREWLELLDRVRQSVSVMTLSLSDTQKARFDETFGSLFAVAGNALRGSMKGSVARLAVNVLRMMSVVAFLRARETPGLLVPDSGIPEENIADGAAARYTLALSDEDFEAVLSLARPLHLHAAYVLSLLPDTELPGRKVPAGDALLTMLGSRFTSAEAREAGRALGVNDNTVRQWLTRMVAGGTLGKESRGVYVMTHARV